MKITQFMSTVSLVILMCMPTSCKDKDTNDTMLYLHYPPPYFIENTATINIPLSQENQEGYSIADGANSKEKLSYTIDEKKHSLKVTANGVGSANMTVQVLGLGTINQYFFTYELHPKGSLMLFPLTYINTCN